MRRLWRKYSLAFLLFAAILAVITARLSMDWWSREPPNWSRIEDGLYLGGAEPKPPSGTQAVLNLCEREDDYRTESDRWQPIHDSAPAPSLEWLREQVEFIETERSAGKNVYVHCAAGISRGGMVVTAYYMAHNGWSRDEALEFVRERRPQVRPNAAFMQLLLEWEKSVKHSG
jgi:hypothetical protein